MHEGLKIQGGGNVQAVVASLEMGKGKPETDFLVETHKPPICDLAHRVTWVQESIAAKYIIFVFTSAALLISNLY